MAVPQLEITGRPGTFSERLCILSLGHIPSTAILCTIDVVSLYPHIPHGEGLEALTRAFDNAESKLPVDELISLARLVLENNYFEFDEKPDFSAKIRNRNWN